MPRITKRHGTDGECAAQGAGGIGCRGLLTGHPRNVFDLLGVSLQPIGRPAFREKLAKGSKQAHGQQVNGGEGAGA